jgi:hypothetical protein
LLFLIISFTAILLSQIPFVIKQRQKKANIYEPQT